MFANDSPLAFMLYLILAALSLYCLYLYLSDRSERTPPHANQLSTPEPPPVATVRLSYRELVAQRAARWDTLTYREQQVARLAAQHWTDAEIAHELHLRPNTVRWYMGEARRKLGIHKRADLEDIVAWLTRHPPQGTGTSTGTST